TCVITCVMVFGPRSTSIGLSRISLFTRCWCLDYCGRQWRTTSSLMRGKRQPIANDFCPENPSMVRTQTAVGRDEHITGQSRNRPEKVRQHTVPKRYLKGFADPDERVMQFDRQSGRAVSVN